jgi:uncharacterized protein YrzB (UPF0473 family)
MTDETKNNNIEEEDDIDTIVFEDEDGNEIEFYEIAFFDFEGKNYSALIPAEEEENETEDGVGVVFAEVTEDEEDYEDFTLVENEELSKKLFAKFLTLQQEADE